MDPHETTIGELLATRSPLQVPPFQRSYAWGKDQVNDYINDLLQLYEEALVRVPHNRHFFGGIVTVMSPLGAPDSRASYEVIDGQQRLATFVLTTAAIVRAYTEVARDAKREGDLETEAGAANHAEVETNKFLLEAQVDEETGIKRSTSRLSLNRVDALFFTGVTEGETTFPTAASHKRLQTASGLIRSRLIRPIVKTKDLPAKERLRRLRLLRRCALDYCYVIHIISTDRNEAYRLFSVLNDRGKRLTDADLLRTRTLELLDDFSELQSQAEQRWNAIVEWKDRETDGFLRAYYASHLGRRSPSTDFFRRFSEEFLEVGEPIRRAEAEEVARRIESLYRSNQTYRKLKVGTWPFEVPAVTAWERSRLTRLIRTLRQENVIPLLLALYEHKDEAFFSSAVQFLERFSFRYNVAGGHASALADELYLLARSARDASDKFDDEALTGPLKKLAARHARDAVFEVRLLDRLKYQPGSPARNRLIAHFLTTIEDMYQWAVSSQTGPPKRAGVATFFLDEVQIEHVYPQSARQKSSGLEPLKHDLGNLSFWGPSDNSAASNMEFQRKKAFYKESMVNLNQELTQVAEWDELSLIERRDRLVRLAKRVFDIGQDQIGREPRVWLVMQKATSTYADREGICYHYPTSIPNGLQITEGDFLVCYENDARLFGVGRVGEISSDGDDANFAYYDKYVALNPPLSLSLFGDDPRANLQNSINALSRDHLSLLLRTAGVEEAESIPDVASEEDLSEEASS